MRIRGAEVAVGDVAVGVLVGVAVRLVGVAVGTRLPTFSPGRL
jgi:ABC-type transporter Mla subunit MlaD